MKGILIIDHGSMKDAANQMLECVGELVQRMAGTDVIVRIAHMELAAPSVADGFAACVAAGATEIVAFPYMLSPGKHSTRDIPRMVAEISAKYPGVSVQVTAAFGVNEQLAAVVLAEGGDHLDHTRGSASLRASGRHSGALLRGWLRRDRRALRRSAWPSPSRASAIRYCARQVPKLRLSP